MRRDREIDFRDIDDLDKRIDDLQDDISNINNFICMYCVEEPAEVLAYGNGYCFDCYKKSPYYAEIAIKNEKQ